MLNKTLIRYDLKNKKEYLYRRDVIDKKESEKENDIGKVFIDFLANSEEIIKIIEDGINYSYGADKKLSEIKYTFILLAGELKEKNNIFNYFNYEEYLSECIQNIKEKNNTEIGYYLKQLKDSEKNLIHCHSKEYYDFFVKNEISKYMNYKSNEYKNAYKNIQKGDQIVSEKIKKIEDKYDWKCSDNIHIKLLKKNEKIIKGENIIDSIEDKVYCSNKTEIDKKVNQIIDEDIKYYEKNIKYCKKRIKEYYKANELTTKEVALKCVDDLKFSIEFAKFVLINYYNLYSYGYHNYIDSDKRLTHLLMHLSGNYLLSNIFLLPKSNITFELNNNNEKIDFLNFIEKYKYDLLDTQEFYNKLNTYKADMVQEYVIEKLEDFINISVVQIIQNNVKICKCDNCEKLFISVNKSNEKYCTYEFKDGKTCRDSSYSIHLQKNELSNILRKKYRTENAKKNRNKHIPKIEEKFQSWYKKAKKQKELCENGQITIEEFKGWLDKNNKWF